MDISLAVSSSTTSIRVRDALLSYDGEHSEGQLEDAVCSFTDELKLLGATPERIIVELKRLAEAAREVLAHRSEYTHERARMIADALGRATKLCVEHYYANPK